MLLCSQPHARAQSVLLASTPPPLPHAAYLWSEGGAHGSMESSLDVGGFGYPALVAYRPGDKKASVCKVRLTCTYSYSYICRVLESLSFVMCTLKSLLFGMHMNL